MAEGRDWTVWLGVAGSLASLTALGYIWGIFGDDKKRHPAFAGLGVIPVNAYGNVDVRHGAPAGYTHVAGDRLTSACRALGVECAPALVGFEKSRGRFRPRTNGVVVASSDAGRLAEYLEKRALRRAKAAPSRRVRSAEKEMERERLAESLGLRADSRTFAAFVRGDIDENEARRIGAVTRSRHEETNYDELLREGYSKEDARALMAKKMEGLPKTGRIPLATARRALRKLPKKSQKCAGMTAAALREGMEIEREHRDVTHGTVGQTAKIAAAHICESGTGYYTGLKKLERRLKANR